MVPQLISLSLFSCDLALSGVTFNSIELAIMNWDSDSDDDGPGYPDDEGTVRSPQPAHPLPHDAIPLRRVAG